MRGGWKFDFLLCRISLLGYRYIDLGIEGVNMDRIIAVDFDGCLCKNEYPNIGEPNHLVITALLAAQYNGAKTILWTCRTGKQLDEAVQWCEDYGIKFDAINENLPNLIESFGNDSRKVRATEYWDDRAVLAPGKPTSKLVTKAQVLDAISKKFCRDTHCYGYMAYSYAECRECDCKYMEVKDVIREL